MDKRNEVNYLTDLRDRYAGDPKRALVNVVGIVTSVSALLWLLSLFGITDGPSMKTVFGSAVAVLPFLIAAQLIKLRWPRSE